MKFINFLKAKQYLCCYIVAGLMVFSAISCNKSEDTPELVKFRGGLNVLNMVPKTIGGVTKSDDKGSVSGTYNPTTKMFDYTVHWVGIFPSPVIITSVIFYNGPAGSIGAEVFRLNNFATTTSEVVKGSYLVPDNLEKQLLAGNFYVVVKHEVQRLSMRAQFSRL